MFLNEAMKNIESSKFQEAITLLEGQDGIDSPGAMHESKNQ